MYTYVYDVSLNCLTFVVLQNLDGFESSFALIIAVLMIAIY